MTTLDYYNNNGKKYAESTINADMSDAYGHFLPLVKKNGRIMDLGCGSGRDSRYFMEQGFEVVAVDGSIEMCRYAETVIGQEVLNLRFEEIEFDNEFDGIWACSSLLHVEKSGLLDVLKRVSKSLKAGGILYVSFKYGEEERIKDGRSFSDFTEKDLDFFTNEELSFELLEYWISYDVRKDRADEKWLNMVLKKKELQEVVYGENN